MQKEVFDTETGVQWNTLQEKLGFMSVPLTTKVHSQVSLSGKLLLIDQIQSSYFPTCTASPSNYWFKTKIKVAILIVT